VPERNAAVLGAVVGSVLEHAPDAVLVVVSNPVDNMTQPGECDAGGRIKDWRSSTVCRSTCSST